MTMNGTTSYPKTYSASSGWKVFMTILGIPLGIGGLAGIWYFGTGHEVSNKTQLVVFVSISIFVALLGFVSAIYTNKTKLLVLTSGDLRVPGIFKSRIVRRSDITGFRINNAQGIDVLEVEFTNSDTNKKKKIRIEMLFKRDDEFVAWFDGITNFDATEYASSVREIESDTELGASPEERLINVNRARKIAGVLDLASLAVVVWAIVYPRPYMAVFMILALMPWCALWLCWKYKGLYSIDDNGKNNVRADLTAILIMPGFILALRAFSDVRLIDATKLIAPSLIGLGFMMTLVTWIAPTYRSSIIKLTIATLLLSIYPASTIAISNKIFDHNDPKTYRLQVHTKRHTTGKGASQYFSVSPWGSFKDTNEVLVPRDLYRQTEIGQTICVLLHPGALDLEWYSVRSLYDF